MSDPFKNLSDAYELVRDPDTRSFGKYARNADGQVVSPFCESAVKFCIIGALGRVLIGTTKVPSSRTAAKTQESQLVKKVLESQEAEFLAQATRHYDRHVSTADMSDDATEDEFHQHWTLALLLAKANVDG